MPNNTDTTGDTDNVEDGTSKKQLLLAIGGSLILLAGVLWLGFYTGAFGPQPASYYGQINEVSHTCDENTCDVTVDLIYPDDVNRSELETVQFVEGGGLFEDPTVLYEREITREERNTGRVTVTVTDIDKDRSSTAFVVRTTTGDGTAHPYSL